MGKPRDEKHNKKLDNEFNVYETEDTTTSLINDIALLDAEEKYMDKVNTQVKKDTEIKTEEALFCYDQELFAVSRSAVRAVADNRVCYQINPPLDQLTAVHKMHRNWLLQSPTCILLLTPWGREEFKQQLGARISNPCGNITCAQPYPVTTFLANPTSVLLGFEKGQVLKFNYNRNRVTDRQTNITHYLPVVEHAKSGDEPAFPLDNRNFLPIEQEKPKPTD